MFHFDKAVEHVLKAEGGYVDHPNDKGGATNFGITIGTLAKYRNTPVTKDDVKNMSLQEAKDIYKAMYWTPNKLDLLNSQILAMALFDQIVNRGASSAVKSFQRAVGELPDGIIGNKTIAAANAEDEKRLLVKFVKDINLFYAGLCVQNPTQLVFLKGWLIRASKLLDLLF